MDVNQELKFFGKFKKKKLGGGRVGPWGGPGWGVGGGGGIGLGGQGGCERRIEVFVKIQKKIFGGWGRWGVRGRVGGSEWM